MCLSLVYLLIILYLVLPQYSLYPILHSHLSWPAFPGASHSILLHIRSWRTSRYLCTEENPFPTCILCNVCMKHDLIVYSFLLYLLCRQELAQSRRDVTQLTTEVEQLRREKTDLVGEVEAHKLTVRSSHMTVTISCVHWWSCNLRVLTAVNRMCM